MKRVVWAWGSGKNVYKFSRPTTILIGENQPLNASGYDKGTVPNRRIINRYRDSEPGPNRIPCLPSLTGALLITTGAELPTVAGVLLIAPVFASLDTFSAFWEGRGNGGLLASSHSCAYTGSWHVQSHLIGVLWRRLSPPNLPGRFPLLSIQRNPWLCHGPPSKYVSKHGRMFS